MAGTRCASNFRPTRCAPATLASCRPSGRSRPRPATGRWPAGARCASNAPTWRPRARITSCSPTGSRTSRAASPETCSSCPSTWRSACSASRSASPASAPATPTTPSPRRPPSRCCWCACSRPSANGSGPPSWRRRYQDDPELRFFFTVVDAGVSTIAGIVKDGVLEHGFDVINDEDWAAWLRRHGATRGHDRAHARRALPAPARRLRRGLRLPRRRHRRRRLRRRHRHQRPAAARLQLPRLGHVQDAGGHGRRGVRARSTRCSTAAASASSSSTPSRPCDPGGNGIDSIEVVPQVEPRSARGEVRPAAVVNDLPCWPSEPLWEQLEAAAQGVDFEAELNPLGRPARKLERGTDFDEVVLGIPVGALPDICGELMARDDRFRRGIESAVTVRTQAFQLWANRASAELGWKYDENSVAGCFVEPLDTYCDMTHLLPRESWQPADGTKTIGYVCGVLDDRAGETPRAGDRARQAERDRVRRARPRRRSGRAPRPAASSTGACWSTATTRPARRASTPSTGAPTPRPGSATCSRPPARSSTACRRATRASPTSSSPATGPRTGSTAAASRRRSSPAWTRRGRSPASRR